MEKKVNESIENINVDKPIKVRKKRTIKIKNINVEMKANEIFMSYYKITCSVLDSKSCSLYHIKEMQKVLNLFHSHESFSDANVFLKDVKERILNGVKMG